MGIEKVENLIIGAGIAGLGAGYEPRRKNKDCVIIERNDSYGGLLDNFVIDGFRFDKFIHLSFTKSEEVRRIFDKTPYHTHNPLSYNYYKGHWLKHPAQNNIYPLPSVEKQKIIDSFYKRPFKTIEEIKDYDEWLRVQYGDYFAEKYANVMFDHNIYKNRKAVRNFLEANGILSAGRFGEWDYYWSDQSLLSGIRHANRIFER